MLELRLGLLAMALIIIVFGFRMRDLGWEERGFWLGFIGMVMAMSTLVLGALQ